MPIETTRHSKIFKLINYFEIDENLKTLFHYNEFSGHIEYKNNAIWHNIKKGKQLDDDDVVYIQYYLVHNKDFEMAIEKIRNAITEISHRIVYNPVKDYLEKLEWDKIPRLDEWLINGCESEDNIYVREIGRKWLTAGIARIYEPAIKFDHVLVLEGKENIGKSTVFRVLGEPWFCDSIDLLQKEQDIVAKMRGHWIIELAEMQGVSKKDVEWIKAFLTCQVDEQRLAYRRDPQKFPRQSIFSGTSNKMAYLLDENGNRRFWPVKCEKINIEWIKNNKDQLWAEAKERYFEKEELYLKDESFKFASKQQKLRLSGDEVMEETIYKFLLNKNETTMREILMDCFKYQERDLTNRSHSMIIGRILLKLGFDRKRRLATDGSIYKYIREELVQIDKSTTTEEE